MKITDYIKSGALKSPSYIFDYDELISRIKILNSKKSENASLCYAIKANPFLIPAIKDSGILFEVCSPGELSICERYDVNPKQIIFSGVCKTKEDVQRAYNKKVKTITLESPLHCKYIMDVVRNTQNFHEQEVILRLTSGNQFGMSESDLRTCITQLSAVEGIKIRGIHFFTGTQKKITKIQNEIDFITNFCNILKKEMSIDFTDIEYGPGLSFNYFDSKDEKNNFIDYDAFMQEIKDKPFNFVVELGRFIASPCGYYLTKIMDVKCNNGSNYGIIDGGINHINYYGQMMGMKVPKVLHIISDSMAEDKKLEKYTICGSLCTTADVVLREIKLQNLDSGDFLLFEDIGAYSITEGIYLFLSHALPSVYTFFNGELNLVRSEQETYIINSN